MMKRQIIAAVLVGMATAIATGCSKHHDAPRLPPPVWKADTSSLYPYSMTAVVKVFKNDLVTGDMLAAFVGDDCRGVGVPVRTGDSAMFYVLIHGTASEQSSVFFQFYDSGSGWLYKTTSPVSYSVNAVYGAPDAPILLTPMEQVH